MSVHSFRMEEPSEVDGTDLLLRTVFLRLQVKGFIKLDKNLFKVIKVEVEVLIGYGLRVYI